VGAQGRWNDLTFKKKGSSGDAMPGRGAESCTNRCRMKEAAQSNHSIHTVIAANGVAITICSVFGAYGSQKAVLLKATCEPLIRAERQSQWAAINEERRHPVSKEAMLDDKQSVHWRVYSLGRPPEDVRRAEAVITTEGPHEQRETWAA
jgi:hypothetical protein